MRRKENLVSQGEKRKIFTIRRSIIRDQQEITGGKLFYAYHSSKYVHQLCFLFLTRLKNKKKLQRNLFKQVPKGSERLFGLSEYFTYSQCRSIHVMGNHLGPRDLFQLLSKQPRQHKISSTSKVFVRIIRINILRIHVLIVHLAESLRAPLFLRRRGARLLNGRRFHRAQPRTKAANSCSNRERTTTAAPPLITERSMNRSNCSANFG